jgi:hypothetical protein
LFVSIVIVNVLVDGVWETSTLNKILTYLIATLQLHFKTWCSCVPRWITFQLKLSCLWMTEYMQALHMLIDFAMGWTKSKTIFAMNIKTITTPSDFVPTTINLEIIHRSFWHCKYPKHCTTWKVKLESFLMLVMKTLHHEWMSYFLYSILYI